MLNEKLFSDHLKFQPQAMIVKENFEMCRINDEVIHHFVIFNIKTASNKILLP